MVVNEDTLLQKLLELREAHRSLDSTISTIVEMPSYDQIELMRLKKEKLMLKDRISRIEDEIYPDIIA